MKTRSGSATGGNRAKGFRRSPCPVAGALDLVGDKWSLLVVRDLRAGKHTFGDLLASPERIPTNILADRLKRLEDSGLIESSIYQERPTRYAYSLTPKGEALKEILNAFVRWGKQFLPGTKTLDELGLSGPRAGVKRRPPRTD